LILKERSKNTAQKVWFALLFNGFRKVVVICIVILIPLAVSGQLLQTKVTLFTEV
jgi:hypothetical protein